MLRVEVLLASVQAVHATCVHLHASLHCPLNSLPASTALFSPLFVCIAHCVVLQEAIPLLAPDQPVSVTVTSGPVVTEITQTWASWASLTTRLYAGADTLEQVG